MLHVLWMEQGLKGIDVALIIFTFSQRNIGMEIKAYLKVGN